MTEQPPEDTSTTAGDNDAPARVTEGMLGRAEAYLDGDFHPSDAETDSSVWELDTPSEFVCSECNHHVAIESSPLHEGDLCPECHQGYITLP